MSGNSFLLAAAAVGYVTVAVMVMEVASTGAEAKIGLIGMVVLWSVFVLSTAVMGYLFLGEPIRLFLAGEKKKAMRLFLRNITSLGGILIVAFILSLWGVVG